MATTKLNIKPTAGYALIEPVEMEKRTATGIVLPDTHDEKSQKGKVIAMGKAQTTDKGKQIVPEFKLGDVVIYKKWGGDEFKLGISGQEYIFVKFEDVLAVTQ
ncbi:co-chaperone GroES [Candidatus Shapirobacteria bacterium CG10_big_fil_rev_8_21_14_0_10_48_15]|uniref:Co-chaperonin GroES n=1 Tax=Candidatus Shapirobacteria bacterium CG10_big_fil_rev_8_21_14_0_10_48_15 TaxID=1974484 RepID=A0A2M8L6S9_9BACT|nr:MAG: co-chaperone GroES [Candidatus Shapirobacteria bacterium CG10_big_fil_rev_8_21_14_0_10_48_15]